MMAAQTLAALAAGLKARKFSSVELTRAYLARIEQSQSRLNALVTVTAESALADAAAADARLAAGTATASAGGMADMDDDICF